LVLRFLVAIIDQEDAAAIEPKAFQSSDNGGQTVQAVYDGRNMFSKETSTIPKVGRENVTKLVLFDFSAGVLVLRDKFLFDVVPDLFTLQSVEVQRQPNTENPPASHRPWYQVSY
jgi:hypothetical protein